MGRTKNLLDGLDLSDGELEQELYLRNDFDYQWESYVKSEDYANMINDEISKLFRIYNTLLGSRDVTRMKSLQD